ncbi:MAG: prephenate dehydrogenase [Planctomycetia bacterium]
MNMPNLESSGTANLDTVAIIGIGLIGGSIGIALRERKIAKKVIGIGRSQASLRTARRVGAVDSTTVDIVKGVAEADLVIACTPVSRIVEDIRTAAKFAREGTLLTDAGSTKQTIIARLETEPLPNGCRFLGAHPMAGSEKTGAVNADGNLFEGRVAVITPTPQTQATDFDTLSKLWTALGSVVVRMSPEEHDKAVAETSHLPHAVAVALSASLPEELYRMAGSGFRDTTRLASGSPELWRDIFTENRDNALRAMTGFARKFSELAEAIRDGNDERMIEILTDAKKKRDSLG